MRIIITGALGALGRAVGETFRSAGHRLTYIGRAARGSDEGLRWFAAGDLALGKQAPLLRPRHGRVD